MFGVLKPDRSLLSAESRHRHASAYCGLCGLIGGQYGFTSRTMVVHDISTLWWLLDESLQTSGGPLPVVNCLRGGTGSIRRDGATDLQRLLAAISIYTLGIKVRDDLSDQPSWNTKAVHAFYGRTIQKARQDLLAIDFDVESLEYQVEQQDRIEGQGVADLETACEFTGKAYGSVARAIAERCDASVSTEQAEVVGKALGQAIYVVDAIRDYSDDLGSQYNPLCLQAGHARPAELPHPLREKALHFVGQQLNKGRDALSGASERLATAWYAIERSLFATVGVHDHQSVTLYSACCIPCGDAFVMIDGKTISGCSLTFCCCYGIAFCGCTNWCCPS